MVIMLFGLDGPFIGAISIASILTRDSAIMHTFQYSFSLQAL